MNRNWIYLFSVFSLLWVSCTKTKALLKEDLPKEDLPKIVWDGSTEWYISGVGAAIPGDDANPGTDTRPFATVQPALDMMKAGYSSGAWPHDTEGNPLSGVISIAGRVKRRVTNRGEYEIPFLFIAGEGAYPPIVLKGSGEGADAGILDGGKGNGVILVADGNALTLEGNLTITGGTASLGYMYDWFYEKSKNSHLAEMAADHGGAVRVFGHNSRFILKGGVIRHNIGGAVAAVYGAAFDMSGGTIRDHALKSNVYINNSAFRMSGGIVEHNYGDMFRSEGAVEVINGMADISGNARISGNQNSGLAVLGNSTVQLRDNAEISENTRDIAGISEYTGGGVFISGIYEEYFSYKKGRAVVLMSGTASIRDNTGSGVIVGEGCSFTMGGHAVISGNTAEKGGGIRCNELGSIHISEGAEISGNTAETGGGIFISAGEGVIEGNARVRGNRATSEGGGIYMEAVRKFELSGNALIDANTAEPEERVVSEEDAAYWESEMKPHHQYDAYNGKGGGVFIRNSVFTMNGNAAIRNNTAHGSGGGVFMENNTYGDTTVFNLVSGTITGNTAQLGGGIYHDSSIFNQAGGEVGNNIPDDVSAE